MAVCSGFDRENVGVGINYGSRGYNYHWSDGGDLAASIAQNTHFFDVATILLKVNPEKIDE
ncbi:hypothetical protein SDC9_159509 [bioreactor metagenome]|uniref:Uncharacterized protein n=1 Tax=bioreactor metagenome TaxID=1076179 RepID=A0A645FD24_9ZZZZ